jgi:hypothetical protein
MHKLHRWLLLASLLTGYLAGCCPVRVSSLPEQAMKGYELYTWQEDGQWYFALLEGTNRLKTDAEIQAAARYLNGAQDLQDSLKRLVPGQTVIWISLAEFPLPDEAIITQVEQICRDLELACSVIR